MKRRRAICTDHIADLQLSRSANFPVRSNVKLEGKVETVVEARDIRKLLRTGKSALRLLA